MVNLAATMHQMLCRKNPMKTLVHYSVARKVRLKCVVSSYCDFFDISANIKKLYCRCGKRGTFRVSIESVKLSLIKGLP
jgi:hypothetical protein